jgi:hypothetical protein
MSESTPSDQNRWLVSDLNQEERTITRKAITDETEIVRYVQLSTLFLYLSDRAFIPSLHCLRGLDPFEGQGWWAVGIPAFQSFFGSLFERFAEFLRGRAVFPATHPIPPIPQELLDFSVRVSRWLDELAKRRTVWCWNLFDGPSNAMWHRYGSRGVAIRSTVGHVKQALLNSGCVRRLIAPVRYAPPSDLLVAAQNFDPIFKATWPSWLMRPYLSKLPGYRYEQEIRYVFGAHPAITKEANGALIKIDGKILVQDILTSEQIPEDEADLIRDLLAKIKAGELQSPEYPAKHQDLWNRRLALVQSSPFTAQDDYPELFPDLDS